MSSPEICFNKTGIIYQNKRYKWTEDEIPARYPPIVRVYLMLYQAQTRWDAIVNRQLTWMREEEIIDVLTCAGSSEKMNLKRASAFATQLTQTSLYETQQILKQSLADFSARKITCAFDFTCQVAINANILHFLCVLPSINIMEVFSILESHSHLFPIYVSPVSTTLIESIEKHTWQSNPFNPSPKIRFDHTTGKLE